MVFKYFIIFREILQIAGESLSLEEENENEYFHKEENPLRKKTSNTNRPFTCVECGTTYANKYAKAAKEHAGSCPLKAMKKGGIVVPTKDKIVQQGLIFRYVNEHIDIITLD